MIRSGQMNGAIAHGSVKKKLDDARIKCNLNKVQELAHNNNMEDKCSRMKKSKSVNKWTDRELERLKVSTHILYYYVIILEKIIRVLKKLSNTNFLGT